MFPFFQYDMPNLFTKKLNFDYILKVKTILIHLWAGFFKAVSGSLNSFIIIYLNSVLSIYPSPLASNYFNNFT